MYLSSGLAHLERYHAAIADPDEDQLRQRALDEASNT